MQMDIYAYPFFFAMSEILPFGICHYYGRVVLAPYYTNSITLMNGRTLLHSLLTRNSNLDPQAWEERCPTDRPIGLMTIFRTCLMCKKKEKELQIKVFRSNFNYVKYKHGLFRNVAVYCTKINDSKYSITKNMSDMNCLKCKEKVNTYTREI